MLKALKRAQAMPLLVWIVSVVGSGLTGLAVLSLLYAEFLDCSNPDIHQSASTAVGWSVAVLASVLPVAILVALRSSGRRWLLPVSMVVAIVEFIAWAWLLNPAGCDWS